MNKNIVVVDDEKRIRDVYVQFLTCAGFNAVGAPTADCANEIVKHNKVDLVLLDLKMPDVQGNIFFDVLKAFHKDSKVIVASVYPMDDQKGMVQGADDYYDKSQGIAILLKKIKQLV